MLAKHYRKEKMSGHDKFLGKLIFFFFVGEIFWAAKGLTRKFNICKILSERKKFGDEKFPGKLIFGGNIWATNS
jgi:hypothetical protein